jgi:hypothetical protein
MRALAWAPNANDGKILVLMTDSLGTPWLRYFLRCRHEAVVGGYCSYRCVEFVVSQDNIKSIRCLHEPEDRSLLGVSFHP